MEEHEISHEEYTKKKQRKENIIKCIFLIFLFAFLLYKTIDYFGAIGYRETWTICLDYLSQGSFWNGQPHCEGAILPFYILWILDGLFGRELVQIATVIFSTMVSALFFWIFLKVVKKESLELTFFWPLLLFGLFFYINTITNIEAVLNSFFFFIAFYLLFYTETKWKYIGSGCFLLLSMLSKINVIVQIVFLLFWYSYEKKVWFIENKKLKINVKKNIVEEYGQIAFPIIVGFGVLTVVYKYFWIYSWSVFTNQTIALSIPQTIKEMIFFDIAKADIIYIPFIVIAFVSTFLFWKEKKVYAFLSGPVFLLSMFLIVRAFGIQFVTGVRYWSVIMPFTILTLLRIKQIWVTFPKKQLFQAIMIVTLLFPGIYYGPFLLKDDLSYIDSFNVIDRITNGWQEKDALVKQIHYGYSIVPKQEGRILMENDPAVFRRTLVSFGSNIPYEQTDFLTKKYMESHPDVWGFPRYKELLGENMIYEPTTEELNEKEIEVVEKIENGTYSLIIYGPPEWAITKRIFANMNNTQPIPYCVVLVPSNVWLTKEGWHYSSFYFKEERHCMEILQNMYFYFYEHFEEICTKDAETANMIGAVMKLNHVVFDKTCTSGGNALEFLKHNKSTKKTELLIMIFLISLPFFWILIKEKKYSEEALMKNQRALCFVILGFYFIMFIMILLFFDATIPYSTGIVELWSG